MREEAVVVAQIVVRWIGRADVKLLFLVDVERLAAFWAIRCQACLVGGAVCGHGVQRDRRVLQPTETDH